MSNRRHNTALSHFSYVHRNDHNTALKIRDHLQSVFRLAGPTSQDNARKKWQNMSMGKLTAVAYNVQVTAHLAECASAYMTEDDILFHFLNRCITLPGSSY